MVDPAAGRQRPPDTGGTGGRGGRRPIQYFGAGSAAQGARPGEVISACHRALRRRRHPALYRQWQPVQSGSTMMYTMMHSDVIRIQLYVPQDEAIGIEPGVKAEVHVPEIPDRVFPGTVTRYARALQPGSRTLLTEIDVPNPDGALSPGIYCIVDRKIPRKTPSFVVPADAVVFDQNGLHVALVRDGIVHMQKISIARDFGKEVLIEQGLKRGDTVILNPMVDLAEGRRVTTQTQPASS